MVGSEIDSAKSLRLNPLKFERIAATVLNIRNAVEVEIKGDQEISEYEYFATRKPFLKITSVDP